MLKFLSSTEPEWSCTLNGRNETRYQEVLKSDEHLGIFLRNMAKFDRLFCEMMMEGLDFTLRFEVHGQGGQLNHCRVYSDGFDRPPDAKATGRAKTAIVKNSNIR
jgi:hypothetical protein